MADRISAEQQARNMLERIGVPDAQSYSASDLIELANLIAERNQANRHARAATMPKLGFTADLELDQRGGAFQRMPSWPDQSSKAAAPPSWPELPREVPECLLPDNQDSILRPLASIVWQYARITLAEMNPNRQEDDNDG